MRTNPAVDFDICGSYDNQRNSTINAERTINMFEYLDPRAKRPKSMIPSSGIVNTHVNFTPETGASRSTFVFKNNIYQVFGGTIFKLSGQNQFSLTPSRLGVLTTSIGYMGCDANTFQVIFVDGQNGYIFDTNTQLLVQITDPAFPLNPTDVCFLDGFFVVISGGTNQFYLSSFNNGLIWGVGKQTFTADDTVGNNWLILTSTNSYQTGTPFEVSVSGGSLPTPLQPDTTYYAIKVDATHIRVALSDQNAAQGIAIILTSNGSGTLTIDNLGQLQEAQVTSHPGTLVACRTLHRRLFLFSQNFTEVWENAGLGTNLPFRRNNSLLMEVGTPSVGSVATGFDRLYFLSQDAGGLGSVKAVHGTEAITISNRALDFQLSQYAAQETNGVSWISDARGILIKENGLIFYRLNFTLANHTFVFCESMSDAQNPRWHEEEDLYSDRHWAQTHAYYNGINYYGDYRSAIFYYVDSAVSTNDNQPIPRIRISRDFAPDGYNRTRIDRFQLDLLQGQVGRIPILDPLQTENTLDIMTENEQDLIVDSSMTEQGPQPTVYLSISKDGGQSYGFRQPALMGNVGQRTYRTVWRKLGTIPRGQGYTVKIEFYNQIPFIVLGASWVFEKMPE